MKQDSLSSSNVIGDLMQNQTIWLILAFFTIIGGLSASIYYLIKIKTTLLSLYNLGVLQIDKSNARIIQRYVLAFLNTKNGKKYCINHSNENLESKILKSFKNLRREKTITQIEDEIYYFYLFALLENSKSKIRAITVSSPYEWTESNDEQLFLDFNISASNRKIPVERIFIIKESEVIELLSKKPILKQILQSNSNVNYSTLFVYDHEVPQALSKDISNGFLLFDSLVVAKDVYSESEIKGIFEMELLNRYDTLFERLKQIARPLNLTYYKEKTGRELN